MAYNADKIAQIFRNELNDMDTIVSFAVISVRKGFRSDSASIACTLASMGFWETKYLRGFI
jgi:hypothetical protein